MVTASTSGSASKALEVLVPSRDAELARGRLGPAGECVADCRHSHPILHVGLREVAERSPHADGAGSYDPDPNWLGHDLTPVPSLQEV